ncbi:MAG: hypothetical protein JWQ62_321, partial [Lacunisphaera sp.]|nr:hypothetical protein [Lacunisphaera sp.]
MNRTLRTLLALSCCTFVSAGELPTVEHEQFGESRLS